MPHYSLGGHRQVWLTLSRGPGCKKPIPTTTKGEREQGGRHGERLHEHDLMDEFVGSKRGRDIVMDGCRYRRRDGSRHFPGEEDFLVFSPFRPPLSLYQSYSSLPFPTFAHARLVAALGERVGHGVGRLA